MSKSANRLMTWESSKGNKKSILMVVDEEKDRSEIGYRKLELCEIDTDSDEWKTIEVIDYVDKVTDFGFPKELVD